MAANFLRDIIAGAVVLGLLVLVHEWGHFVAAKLCGVRVEVFSIGFGARIWGWKRGDTDYRVSALPLGGYVRMAGDNPIEERTGADYEFLSRPRWQRFLIAIAGPSMNIFVAFLIFWGIYALAGMPVDSYFRQPADVVAVPMNREGISQIRPGDRVISVNGVATPDWEKLADQVKQAKPGDSLSVVIARDGSQQTLALTVPQGPLSLDTLVGYPKLAPQIDEVQPGSPAQKAGLDPGDTVVSINGDAIVTWQQMVDRVRGSGGQPIHFVVLRDGKQTALDITPTHTMSPEGDAVWIIGASPKADETFERQGIFTSARDAAAETVFYARMIGNIFSGLFRGKVSVRDLAGPVGIVQMSGQAAKGGHLVLLRWMAYISLNLGLMNLLPIPILDGGHVLMLAIEGLMRRDLSITFKERFVQVGLVFLLGLFAVVMYNDIVLRVIR